MSRAKDELRPVSIERNFATAAPGSVLFSSGDTRVLCTASIETDMPGWMRDQDPPRGWVTAEYNMLPGSTAPRKRRKTDGRSMEIQRLIARVLRAAVDLEKMPGLIITCDCEILKADGGTRTASITGAYIALADAIKHALKEGLITENPLHGPVAAVSVGIIKDEAFLDLDYPLDFAAQVDMNVAMNHKGEFIEIQGTGEESTFTPDQLNEMMKLAQKGIADLIKRQEEALAN